MSNWGVLAGLGQGLSTYSAILKERGDKQFQLNRDDILFERQKNLEAIRNTNQMAEGDRRAGMDRAENDRQWKRGRDAEPKGMLNGVEIDNLAYEQMPADQKSQVTGLQDYEDQRKIKNAKGVVVATAEAQSEIRDKELDSLKADTEFWNSLTPMQQSVTEKFYSMDPDVAKLIMNPKQNQITPELLEVHRKIYAEDKDFIESDPKGKLEMLMTSIAMSTQNKEAAAGTEGMAALAVAYSSGKLTKAELLAKTKGTPWEQYGVALTQLTPSQAEKPLNVIVAAKDLFNGTDLVDDNMGTVDVNIGADELRAKKEAADMQNEEEDIPIASRWKGMFQNTLQREQEEMKPRF